MHHLNPQIAAQIADMAMSGLVREYPCKPGRILQSPADLVSPRTRTPSFYGCFDWHSAVHAHWTLARLLQIIPNKSWSPEACSLLRLSLCRENLQAELAFREGNPHFEMPYGVAWLLYLQATLHSEKDADPWPTELDMLCQSASQQFQDWLSALPCPIRSGEHSQSAFAMAMVHDAATQRGDQAMMDRVATRSIEFYGNDKQAPLSFEPSAHDFLSPCLSEADLLTRVMTSEQFADWFEDFWGQSALTPVQTSNRQDGKLTHWDGLNLSRAWMLARIAAHLPAEHGHAQALRRSAQEHLTLGLQGLSSEHYAGSHWLGSFALYALSEVPWPASP